MYGDEQLKIMSIINSGKTFSNGEQLTADKLNQVIEQASFNSNDAVDGSSTTVIGTAISVRDGGISPAKLSSGGPTWRSSDGALRVGRETDDSYQPNAFVKGRRQSKVDTLELNSNDDIEFTTGSSTTGSSDQRMIIKQTGMVGINQASPVGTLHITDIGDKLPTLFLEGASATEGDIAVSHTDALQIGHWNKTNKSFAERMTFQTSGNVGIGESSPSAKLEVRGTFRVSSTAAEFNHIALENSTEVFGYIGGRNGDFYINAGGTKDKLRLATNGSDRLIIQQNGNVGVNTSSPDEKLDVNGNIQINGNIKEAVNNNLIRIQGGHDDTGANTGAHLDLYGGTHSSNPSLAVLDADEHRLRTQSGSDRLRVYNDGSATLPAASYADVKNRGTYSIIHKAYLEQYVAKTPSSGATGTLSSNSSSWQTLDLSTAAGGDYKNIVHMEVRDSSGNHNIMFRTYGSSLEIDSDSSYAGWGASGSVVQSSNKGGLIVAVTDGSSRLQYKSNNTMSSINYTIRSIQRML